VRESFPATERHGFAAGQSHVGAIAVGMVRLHVVDSDNRKVDRWSRSTTEL